MRLNLMQKQCTLSHTVKVTLPIVPYVQKQIVVLLVKELRNSPFNKTARTMLYITKGVNFDVTKGYSPLCIGVGSIFACVAGYSILKRYKKHQLHVNASVKKSEEEFAFENLVNKLTDDKEYDKSLILNMDAKSIIAALQERSLDLDDVLNTYFLQAYSLTKQFNCVTSVVTDALVDVSALSHTKAKELPLFGLPVSLKESIKTKGAESTIGMIQRIETTEKFDAVLVKVLRSCGAVPFVKTNLPQLLLSFSSCNPIYGETSNPHKNGFTPGGSSSGEGCLIGGGGSLLGFGTDMAGSIRQPAHLCGICGLKPTMNRISKKGLQGSIPGQTLISATVGPMAKNVETLALAMKALLCPLMFSLDPAVPPLVFDSNIYEGKRKLVIGYYCDDGYNKPIPAVTRAVEMAKQALEDAGHQLIPFQVPSMDKAMQIFTSAIYADGGKSSLKLLSNDLEEPRLQFLYNKWKCPSLLRKIATFFLKLKWPRIAQDFYLHGGESCSVERLWKLECEAAAYKKDFFALWDVEGMKLDGIICPPFPIVAGPHKHFENMTALMGYTALYNLVNCPAGVVPVTKVTQADIDMLQNFKGHFQDPWDVNIKKACKESINMPVGVQCVAKPWQDEMCLRIMREIEFALLSQS